MSLADLAGRPMVNLGSDTFREGRNYWAQDPRPDGTRVRYTEQQVPPFESLLSAVSLGRAIAFVPAAAATLYPRPDLRYLPVDDLRGCAFGVVWHSSDHDTPKITSLEERTACARPSRDGRLRSVRETPAAAAANQPWSCELMGSTT